MTEVDTQVSYVCSACDWSVVDGECGYLEAV